MRRALAATLAVIMMMSGCSKEAGMQPTITGAQAIARAQQIAEASFRALPAGATLQPGRPKLIPCDAPTDGGPEGRVFAEISYDLAYPADWAADQVLPALTAYWSAQGYTVTTSADDGLLTQTGAEDADGFGVTVRVYTRGPSKVDVYLIGSSPCVWENGTPPVS